MNTEDLAQNAYAFNNEFKAAVMQQINELNAIADGELQDGFNATYLEDGWVSLKGYSWGFVMQYDNPARIDMTFGPDWPFVGYKITFAAKPIGGRIAWVNEQRSSEVCFDAPQLARLCLRKLACKAGDDGIFDKAYAAQTQQPQAEQFFAENI